MQQGPAKPSAPSFAAGIAELAGAAMLVITCGLPGTGKSTIAGHIAKELHAKHLMTDEIRRRILSETVVGDPAQAGDMGRRLLVYEELFRQAEPLLAAGGSVLLDATFINRSLRQRAAGLAARYGCGFMIVQTTCRPETAIRRITARDARISRSNALQEEAYWNNAMLFETPDLPLIKERWPSLRLIYLVLDTDAEDTQGWRIIKTESY